MKKVLKYNGLIKGDLKNMRKTLSIIIIFSLLIIMISFSKKRVEDTDTTKLVGFTLPSIGNDFMYELSEQIKSAVEQAGTKVQVDSADGDVNAQISQIENYINMKVDLIVVFAISGEAVVNACEQAISVGIPVVAFAVEIPTEVTSAIVVEDNYELGRACAQMAGEWIENNFKEKVDVLVMGSAMTPQMVERTEGLSLIEENPQVNVRYVEPEDHDSIAECRRTIENAFTEYPDYDVVLCVNGTEAIAVENFVSSSSSPVEDISKFGIFCIDETDEIDRLIADNGSGLRGTVSIGSIQDSVNDLLQGVMPILAGKTPVKRINRTAEIITEKTLQ